MQLCDGVSQDQQHPKAPSNSGKPAGRGTTGVEPNEAEPDSKVSAPDCVVDSACNQDRVIASGSE